MPPGTHAQPQRVDAALTVAAARLPASDAAGSGRGTLPPARPSQVVDALPAGVVVLNALGVVETCNPAARELFGEDPSGVLWRDVARRLFRPRPDDGPDLSLADGRRVHIATCSLSQPPGQLLLLQDVTEVRDLQSRIGQLERLSAMGEMAAALAHQVRTPLASALLYAGALARPAVDVARYAGRLLGVLRHLEGLVRDMLLFARQGRFDMEDLTVGALIAGVTEHLMPRLEARGVRLECQVATPRALLRGSGQALAGALENLIDNACEAGASRVELACAPLDGERIALDVVDDGPGISEKLRARLFEPFFTTRPGGSGLGLAVARAVAQAHGGTVRLVQGPTPGAHFRLELPLWRETASGDAASGVARREAS